MATYAIGDVQGCYGTLQALLEKIGFNPELDRLWFVGDLVNRGPQSLETLRFVRELGKAAIAVLGNHDLYLLKIALCNDVVRKRDDSLAAILNAPDRDELMAWLRARPLMHVEKEWVLVHAGLLPDWSIEQACGLASEVETVLRGDRVMEFLAGLWGDLPDAWDERLQGIDRLRVIVNAMTRMRFCTLDGRMDFCVKGGIKSAPRGCVPWFAHPLRASTDRTIICGHWSALGLHLSDGIAALDTGCVWGGKLTALRLEDGKVFQVRARKNQTALKNA